YWHRSHGYTPPAGSESVKLEDALPPWAKPAGYGAGAPTSATATTPTGPTYGASAWSGGERGGSDMRSDIARTYAGNADRSAAWARDIGSNPAAGAVPGSGGAFM